MRDAVNAAMRALLAAQGCLDAAAAVIEARWGRGASKGTLSKKATGQLDWTITDLIALEDGAGRYPVTALLARRMASAGAGPGRDLSEGAGALARETGEAVAAILSARSSGAAGDVAQALVEVGEARVLIEAIEAQLRGLSS